MPELPEVEVVRQSLDRAIKQKKVKNVIVRNSNLRFKIPPNFKNLLKNKRVVKVNRFSKYLIICLSDESYCLVHLGMSGTIHMIKDKKKSLITNTSFYSSLFLPKKHNHVEIIFENLKIIYNDPRRFGFFEIIENTYSLNKRFKDLGPEPFDKRFSIKYVLSFFRGKKKNIKNFLLDQRFVSGIGNIYASEILYLCCIKPSKLAYTLRKNDCRNIVNYSKKVLLDSIKKGGSTIKNFKNAEGDQGSFQKNFKVYEREGLRCKRYKCNGIIEKKIISNRSSFFCNLCQK